MGSLAYGGQSAEEIGRLDAYRHYRESNEETRLRIFGKRAFNSVESNKKAVNTLESLTSDLPRSTWSLTLDSSKLVAFLRSFKWPGFLAYNRANSPVFGYCYFGDGRVNNDLVFTS